MLNDLLYAFWIFGPAGMANVTPILVSKIPVIKSWTLPLDFGKELHGTAIFGANKTWRGLICGILAAELVFLLERHIAHSISVHNFAAYLRAARFTSQPLILGALLGCGALVGDAVESFFKRRANRPPGSTWFPFDQLDYIVGGCLFAAIVAVFPLSIYIWIIGFWFVTHLVFSYLGFLLKFKSRPI